ncbi:hypothetical protein Q3G72_029185 [Acer saccharum]|nr:hypothetical protein Q3G72_029185 [Acer saccharum]
MAAQFNPTDQELVERYLYNFVHGNPLPTEDDVLIADLYGDDNWKNFFEFFEKNTLYFFTELKQKSETDHRIRREARRGTWRGEQGPQVINDAEGNTIGSKRNFSFMPRDGSVSWIMHEYRSTGGDMNVLCRIEKRNRNQSTAAIDEEAVSRMMMELENDIRGGGEGEGGHREP